MEWPQFTTMEHLLASKQGNYGTLSIVVRPSSSDVSRSRVNLAAVGLAPLEGGGNAAIVHEFEGHIHAYHTSAEHPYDLGFSNRVPGEGLPVVGLRRARVSGRRCGRRLRSPRMSGRRRSTRSSTTAASGSVPPTTWHDPFSNSVIVNAASCAASARRLTCWFPSGSWS